jgi:endonuclease/exonuclease/phosphatase family metal-dependent hydrolase
LRLLVTHLDHEDDGLQTRLDQIDAVLAFWGGDPQTLVLGDINAEPDSMEYRRLTGAGLRDLLSESGSPSPTSPSSDPVTRIDYAFASSGVELVRADTPKSLASDHLPIFVELQIP